MLRGLRLAGTAAAAAAAWWLLLPPPPGAQPAPFDHARHAGLACSVCHAGVETAATATVPRLELCQRCHATPPAGFPGAVFAAGKDGAGAQWNPVTRLPRHVWFSHRRHVSSARLACASCHGEVGTNAELPGRPPVRLDMAACLSCHRREGVTEDCASCHR